MAQSKGKYWLANNPNGGVIDAEAVEVKAFAEALEVGGIDALGGDDSPGDADTAATKCLKVNINGTDYWIPLYEANDA